MTYARGNKEIYSIPRNFPSRDFCAWANDRSRSISDYGAKVPRLVPPHFPWKKKKKRSVVGSEINFGAPYLANALKSVGEPVERVIQGGTDHTTTIHRLYTTILDIRTNAIERRCVCVFLQCFHSSMLPSNCDSLFSNVRSFTHGWLTFLFVLISKLSSAN